MADIWNTKAENAIEEGMSTIFRRKKSQWKQGKNTVDCIQPQRESQQRTVFHVVFSQKLHNAASCCNIVADLCTCSKNNTVNIMRKLFDHNQQNIRKSKWTV
jgi:hypothetical protein